MVRQSIKPDLRSKPSINTAAFARPVRRRHNDFHFEYAGMQREVLCRLISRIDHAANFHQ